MCHTLCHTYIKEFIDYLCVLKRDVSLNRSHQKGAGQTAASFKNVNNLFISDL